MTADQLEMISTNPGVMHGQAVIAGTRVPVSVILDCLAAGMTAEEITTEYPTVTVAGVRGEHVGALGAAAGEHRLARPPHMIRIDRITDHLQREISFHRRADVERAVAEQRPAAVVALNAAQIDRDLFFPARHRPVRRDSAAAAHIRLE